MQQIITETKEFIEICRKLKQAGYKKKDIASVLNMPAPVLSSLIKTVLPAISQISTELSKEEIETEMSDAFVMVNNLSRTKIAKRLSADIVVLSNLLENNDLVRTEKSGYLNFIKHQAEFSYNYISKYFYGIYYFYYLSTDNYQIKADPILIRPNIVDRIIDVYKGNSHSSVKYFGIALLNNNHTLTMQLAENHESPEEYIQIVLSLPFIRQVDYLRGVFSNLNFVRQPIARKVVLHKISDQYDFEFFNSLEVKRFDNLSEVDIPEIGNYLFAENAKTECHAVSKPAFNFTDLNYEIEVAKERKLE